MVVYPMGRSRVTAAVNSVPFEPLPSLPKRANAYTHTASSQPADHSSRTFPGRAALMALVVWMFLESWGIVAALVDQREGGWLAAVTAVAILLSALVSSVAGFAFSAIAGSALAYLEVEPVRAVQMMVVCSIATQLYAVWNIRESIRWRSVLPMIGAGAVTIPLGVWLLLHADALLYAAGLGAFLTAYGCYIAFRRESSGTPGGGWHDAAAGALGGLTGGLAGIPGAPVTIWCSMRGWDKLTQRAVYQPYILAMQIVAIVCLRCQTPEHLSIAHDLSLVPFALLGAIGGLAIFRLMSNRQFQVAVSVLLVISGLGLLGRLL
jgi:uncharacterized protein